VDPGFKTYIDGVLGILNERTESISMEDYGSDICPIVRDITNSGKRIRPLITILSCQATGGEIEDAIPLAMAIELVHNASLVHDDIIDGDKTRRGEPTIDEKFGTEKAIIIGNSMISLAISLVADYDSEVVRLLSMYGFDLCVGEILDLSSSLDDVTEDLYFLKIEKKSASLFKASTHMGALVGGGTKDEIEAMSKFGEDVGIAYQISDDLMDLDMIAESGDLRNGIVTLPLIYFYGNGNGNSNENDKERELLKDFGGDMDRDTANRIIEEIKESGSIQYCEKRIHERVESAQRSLNVLRESEFKEYLLEVPDFILAKENS